MSYLTEFQKRVENKDFPGLLHLWEEYCSCDEVDGVELKEFLELMLHSDFKDRFGKYCETVISLWQAIDNPAIADQVFMLLIDIQTTNSPVLAELCCNFLQERYGSQEHYDLKLRLVGLKSKDSFRGAIRNYLLLTHLNKGNFVFHTAGWGTGEIIELSLVRQQLSLEFENVLGVKDMSFENAFKTLLPLDNEHFLAKRFGRPDELEKEAKKDPLKVIHLLLKDLGHKTAAEIKEEMMELVIPEKEWASWWQNTRAKLKKDTLIAYPKSLQEPFKLRSEAVSHLDRLKSQLKKGKSIDVTLNALYNFSRDFPNEVKGEEAQSFIQEHLDTLEQNPALQDYQRFILLMIKEDALSTEGVKEQLTQLIQGLEEPLTFIQQIGIGAYKKRALSSLRKHNEDWKNLFGTLLISSEQNLLRDYLLRELSKDPDTLQEQLQDLLQNPQKYPEALVWYFQKALTSDSLPFSSKEGRCQLLEVFLILLSQIELNNKYRDLCKRMIQLLTQNRFKLVRDIIEGTSLEFLKEFLLLVSKSHSLSDHDKRVMQSLAEVVQPALADIRKENEEEIEEEIFWTTEEGFRKVQERMEQIANVEVIANAKEIEEARAHGDLRENSEYKYAQEKRHRLQGELRRLGEQVKHCRVITPDDIDLEVVGIGNIVELEGLDGSLQSYTLLGPWDADSEKNIISIQSKLAQAMKGCSIGESFDFQGDTYKVTKIKSAL